MLTDLVQRFGDRARRMGQMMDRMRVDAVALIQGRHGGEFLKARARCAGCQNTEVCEHSYESWLAGRPNASPKEFCPNYELFAEYREKR